MNRQIKAARQHLNVLSASPALCSPTGYLERKGTDLAHLKERLVSAQLRSIDRKSQRYAALTAKLDAMSPLKVLSRGYAMTQKADGSVIRSVSQVAAGDTVEILLCDGSVTAAVTDVKENVK